MLYWPTKSDPAAGRIIGKLPKTVSGQWQTVKEMICMCSASNTPVQTRPDLTISSLAYSL
jgi:hypothetical protein